MNKTNKNALMLALLMAAFVVTPTAFAEGLVTGSADVNTTVNRPANPEPNWRTQIQNLRGDIKDKRTETKEEVERMRMDIDAKQKGLPEMRDSIQGKKGEMKEYAEGMREKIKQTAAQMVGNRVAAMFERITKLQGRVDSRMAKLAAMGKDVTAAKTHLDLSQKALTEARTKATTIKLDNMSDLKTVRDSVKAVQTLLQTAHKELQLSVAAMQKVSGEVKAEVKAGTNVTR